MYHSDLVQARQQRVGIIVVPVLSSPGPSASNLPAWYLSQT